jgi:hypothetical protein
MKLNKLWLASVIVAVAAVLSTMISAPSSAKNPQGDGKSDGDVQRLGGSWILTANIEGQPLIHALITFSRDGSFVETAAAPGVSTGHGAWSKIGRRKFSLTNVYLRLDTGGQFIGTSKVRADFEVDKNLGEGSGRFETEVFDADGNLLDTFGGTAQATRIEGEPLE